MKTLVKIRFKYFQRHVASFIFGYLITPITLLVIFFIYLIVYIKDSFSNSLNSELLLKNSFTNLTPILKNTYLISENIEDRIELKKFIYKETNVNITTYSSESEILDKNFNILTMENIDNKFNFFFPNLTKKKIIILF